MWYSGGWKSFKEFFMLSINPIEEIFADHASSPHINFGIKIMKFIIKMVINIIKRATLLSINFFINKLYNNIFITIEKIFQYDINIIGG